MEPIATEALCVDGLPAECNAPAAFVAHIGGLSLPYCERHAQNLRDLAWLATLDDRSFGLIDQLRARLVKRRVDAIQREHEQRLNTAYASPEYADQVAARFGDVTFGPNTLEVKVALDALDSWILSWWSVLAQREKTANGAVLLENPFWPTLSPERDAARSRAFATATRRREFIRLGESRMARSYFDAARRQATDLWRSVLEHPTIQTFGSEREARFAWHGAENLVSAYVLRPWLDEADFELLIEPYRTMPGLPGFKEPRERPESDIEGGASGR